MYRDDIIEYLLDVYYSDEEGKKICCKIWVVIGIFMVIIVIEVLVGMYFGCFIIMGVIW